MFALDLYGDVSRMQRRGEVVTRRAAGNTRERELFYLKKINRGFQKMAGIIQEKEDMSEKGGNKFISLILEVEGGRSNQDPNKNIRTTDTEFLNCF